MLFKLLCISVCVQAALAQIESMVVQIDQGLLRGYKDTRGDFYSFFDVPYATAPTGRDKYKAPLPAPLWTNTFDAVNRWIACPQALPIPSVEDCLVANIFVPNTNDTNLPVLVNIHGGAYTSASGYFFPLTNLAATQKTIVVTFNYRLGVFGFLCLGTDDVPGNAGMKDQVALLRWVNRNIASFGGNPDDVTISGCSAGGGSVDFLTVSPMAAGLFKKAITESGATLGVTGTQHDPIVNAKIYGRQLNFENVDDLSALEEFFKTASNEVLLSAGEYNISESVSILFSPCVERETGEESFLPDAPVNIIKSGKYSKVPLVYGFTEMEGLLVLTEFNEINDKMNENFANFIPDDLEFDSEAQKEEIAARIKDFYFGSQGVTEDSKLAFVDYFTDILFAYPMLRSANLRRESLGDTIYLYEYSFVNDPSILSQPSDVHGSGHCHQFFAVVDEDITNATAEYVAMRQTMRKMWIDFITTGTPTAEGSSLPSWPAVSGYLLPYMNLNETSHVIQSPMLEERIRFWNSIYDEHYRLPVPPSSAVTLSLPIFLVIFSKIIIAWYYNHSV